jgi:WD40 repeat protein
VGSNELTEAVFRDALDRMPAPVRMLRPPGGTSRRVGSAANGTVFSAENDRRVRIWDRDGRELESLPMPSTDGAVAAMPKLDMLLSFADGVFYTYDLGDGTSREMTIPDAPRPPYSAFRPVEIRPIGDAAVFLRVKNNGWIIAVDPGTRVPRVLCPLVFCRSELGDEGPGHSAYSNVYGTAASMSGQRILTLGHDATARLWTAEGTEVAVLEDIDRRNFASGAFIRDDVVVTGTEAGRGQLWASDGEPGTVFREPARRDLFVIAVHPDRDSFAVRSNDGTGAFEVRSRSGELISSLAGHTRDVRSAAFSPDGRYLASGSDDCTVRVWDWRDGRQILELSGHTDLVLGVTFPPSDGTRLLSVDFAGSIRQWSLDRSLFPVLSGHRQGVSTMHQAGSRIVTSGGDGATRLWRGPDLQAELGGELLAYVPPRGAQQAAVAFTHDPERDAAVSWLLPGNSDESPVRQGEFPETVVTALRDQVFAGHEVVMSPDASRVIIQGELWSLAGEHIARLIGPNDSLVATTETKILGAGFQPGGEKIVTAAGNGMVWFWAADGTLAGSVVADSGSPDAVFGIAIDPLGKYVAVGVREKTSLWSWDGEERYRLPTAGYKVKRLCFAPDGSRLITVATPWPESPKDAWVELWPRSNQKIVVDIDDDAWPAFDPSSRYFFLHDAAAVRIFDLDGEPLGTLAGPFRTGVTGITASADGDFVAASFTDGVARIWSLAAGRRLTALRIGQATGIVFSPDNQRLLAASPDGQIRQHAVSIQELIPAAAHRLDRVLTRDERTRFSIQDPVRLDLNALRRMRHEDG